MKGAGVIIFLALSSIMISAVYAVSLNLDSGNVAQVGGTGTVDVQCPASGCTIDSVKWVVDSNPPYKITGATIDWTTADSGATYTVYLTVYDNTDTVIASGSATQTGDTNPVSTTIDFGNSIDAKDIYKVEVVIVEQ